MMRFVKKEGTSFAIMKKIAGAPRHKYVICKKYGDFSYMLYTKNKFLQFYIISFL